MYFNFCFSKLNFSNYVDVTQRLYQTINLFKAFKGLGGLFH